MKPTVCRISEPVWPLLSAVLRSPPRPISHYDFDAALARQRAKGLEKHGTELHTFNGRSALRDFAEEIADALQYGTQAMMEDPLRAAEVLEAVALLQVQLVKVAAAIRKGE